MKYIHLTFIAVLVLITTFPIALKAQSRKIIKPSKDLINFYFNSPRGKADVPKDYQGDKLAAASDLLVTAINIDRDGKPEYFVKRKSFCNSQDCLVTLYKQKGKTFVELFSAQNLDIGEEFDAQGMRNLKSCAVDSTGGKGICTYYKWNKKEYVIFKCMEAVSEKSTLKAKIVPCSKID